MSIVRKIGLIAAGAMLLGGVAAPAMATQEDSECQHYSWTGGPLNEGETPPRAPGEDWQANTAQEPHRAGGGNPATWVDGEPGLHYTGEPGRANWFDYVCDKPPEPCPTVTVPGPTVTATERVTATATVTASGEPGPTVTATATETAPGPTVTATETATATATVTATATETAVVPGPTLTVAGPTVTATATEQVPGPTATVTFCPVTGTVTQGTPDLAATGASSTLWTTAAGLLALGLGGYLAFAASRRKGAHE